MWCPRGEWNRLLSLHPQWRSGKVIFVQPALFEAFCLTILEAMISGFWNYTSKENWEDLLRYLEVLFYLIYKQRAKNLLQEHLQR